MWQTGDLIRSFLDSNVDERTFSISGILVESEYKDMFLLLTVSIRLLLNKKPKIKMEHELRLLALFFSFGIRFCLNLNQEFNQQIIRSDIVPLSEIQKSLEELKSLVENLDKEINW